MTAVATDPMSSDPESGARRDRPITVLGVGSVLRTDDGVGVHLLRSLAGTLPAHVELVDGGTLSFSLLENVAGRHGLIVIDAAQLEAPAGTVRVFEGADMDAFLGRKGALSVHEVSISELLDMARLRDELPPNRAMIAIQPGDMDWGSEPAEAVSACLPDAARMIRGLIEAWR